MFSSIFADGPSPRNRASDGELNVNVVAVDRTIEVKAGGSSSSRSAEQAQWDHLLALLELQKKEVALSVNALKRELEDHKKDFKDYVSRSTREDAAMHVAAGKERKETIVALAEVHTNIELLKAELKKMRTTSLEGQVPGKVETHVLKERVKAVESKLDNVAIGVDPLHSKVGVAVTQLDRKMHSWSEELHSSIRKESEKLRSELESVRATAAPLGRDLELRMQEVRERLDSETEKLREELDGLRQATDPLRDALDSRTQAVHSQIKEESSRLWSEFSDLRDGTSALRRDLESHQQGVLARIQDETSRLQTAIDEVRQPGGSRGARGIDGDAEADELDSLVRRLDDRLTRLETQSSRTTELSEILASRVESIGVKVRQPRSLEECSPASSPEREQQLQQAVELGEVLARRVDQQAEQLRDLNGAAHALESQCSACVDRVAMMEECFTADKVAMQLAVSESMQGVDQRRQEDEIARQALRETLEQYQLMVCNTEQVGQALAGTAAKHDEQLRELRAAQREADERCQAVQGRCEYLAKEVADRHALEIQSLKYGHDEIATATEGSAREVNRLHEAHRGLAQQCTEVVQSFSQLEERLESLCTEQHRNHERGLAECGSRIEGLCAEHSQRRQEDLDARVEFEGALEKHSQGFQELYERYERESVETRQLILRAPQDAREMIDQCRRKVERATEVSEIVAERQEGILRELQSTSVRLQDDVAEAKRIVDAVQEEQRRNTDEVQHILAENRHLAKAELAKAVEGEMAVRRRCVEQERLARVSACDELSVSVRDCMASLANLEQQLCSSVDGSA